MKIPTLLFLLTAAAFAEEPKSIPASGVTWQEHFGYSDQAKETSLCLMATGFFRSPTSNVRKVMQAWLKEHPKARVMIVSTMGPIHGKVPEVKLGFVWIVDGESSLNVELVRQGCLPPGTQTVAKDQKLDVPQKDYDAFLKKVEEAGKAAEEAKAGVWKQKAE